MWPHIYIICYKQEKVEYYTLGIFPLEYFLCYLLAPSWMLNCWLLPAHTPQLLRKVVLGGIVCAQMCCITSSVLLSAGRCRIIKWSSLICLWWVHVGYSCVLQVFRIKFQGEYPFIALETTVEAKKPLFFGSSFYSELRYFYSDQSPLRINMVCFMYDILTIS